jgi:hypothetical protein
MAESRMAGVEVRRRPSICDSCDRLRKRSNLEAESSLDKWIPYCEGFPDRVPREIYTGRFDHREPYPGDNGIRFQLVPAASAPCVRTRTASGGGRKRASGRAAERATVAAPR